MNIVYSSYKLIVISWLYLLHIDHYSLYKVIIHSL